jgi:penicillin amidase
MGARDEKLVLPGLAEPVTVVFDRRRVPHIFAQNAHDLFFAQGYVTARDRLWQMEIQALAGAGRLAEVLGPGLIEHDRFQRRLGIPQAAARSLEFMFRDEETAAALKAYTEGVNAWIAGLDPEDYPIEYKLLDYAPGKWSALYAALMLKNMQWTLTGGGDDLPLTNTLAKLGREFTGRFFPLRHPETPPIFPAGTVWDTAAPVPPPGPGPIGRPLPPALLPFGAPGAGLPGDSAEKAAGTPPLAPAPGASSPGSGSAPSPASVPPPASSPGGPSVPDRAPDPGNGSNNFVVAGAHTASGHPLLANDPHLELNLPSIWYEIQLSAPGVSAYGVSLPGAPTIIIGFNRKIAWGMTNGGDDVLDWYRVTFKDASRSEYLSGGKWKPTRKEVEAIKVRGGATVLDTIVYTHQGPVVLQDQEKPFTRNTPAVHAMRWLALDPSNEVRAFLGIMRARDYASFSAALDDYHCPAQNFAFAAADGDIALFHHGLYPRKWKGQGRFLLDGSEPGNDWSGWLPRRYEPAARNPAQGWLASANQSPADSAYPFYLGAGYLDGPRARRLSRLVGEAESLTVDGAFAVMQDEYDLTAADLVPALLPRIAGAALSPDDSAARRALAAWDFRHRPDSKPAALFDRWWKLLYKSVWSDEFGGDSVHYQWPSKDRTRKLILEEPDAEWFDDITTPARENLSSLALRTFRDACASLRRGPAGPPGWAEYRPVDIQHLARIAPFGALGVRAGGCPDCVNALKGGHGPSWRMVVDLTGEPRGYGVYPGGQSGNPGSPYYADFIPDWAAGRHYPLSFWSDPGAAGNEAAYRLRMRGP